MKIATLHPDSTRIKLGLRLVFGTMGYYLFTHRRLGVASISDSLKIGFGVALPTIVMGPIIRRPKDMQLAEKLAMVDRTVKIFAKYA